MCAIFGIFAWFLVFFAHILCEKFSGLKFCQCYFVSFFHLCVSSPRKSQWAADWPSRDGHGEGGRRREGCRSQEQGQGQGQGQGHRGVRGSQESKLIASSLVFVLLVDMSCFWYISDSTMAPSLLKTGVFCEPVPVITNGGSWVVVHMMEHPPVCQVVNVMD